MKKEKIKLFRHEFKYHISYIEYISMRQRLKHVLKLDKHALASGDYHIRSLYFDDSKNTALFEKQIGINSRKKYRIRIYNISDSVIKLEKKSRIGQFISKESVFLTRENIDSIVAGKIDFMRDSDESLLNELYFDMKSYGFKPIVIVDYEREAYVSSYGNIRVTFDKKLKTGLFDKKLFDKNLPTVDVLEDGHLILEVKYDNYLPDHIRNIIQVKNPLRDAISKYTYCRKHTKLNSWEDQ